MQDNINQLRMKIREELRTVFPNQFNFTRKEFASIAGVSEGHISNCETIYKRPLVIPVREGSKVLYPVIDVIEYLVTQRLGSSKSKRGARTKASRINKSIDGGGGI